MTFQFSAQSDINKTIKQVGRFYSKQVPFAAAVAMTKTAQKVRDIEKLVMQQVFKTTSRYTLGALFVKPARKSDFARGRMSSDVWLIGHPSRRNRHYLYPHVHGGQRDHGGFERRLIAAGIMRRDEYAVKTNNIKVTKGMYQKILAQLQAYNDPYQNATGSTRSRRNRRGQAFFAKRTGKARGIWMRKGTRRNVMPVFVFVKSARYQPRFDFYGVAQKTSAKFWPRQFNLQMQRAIRTAR